MQEGVPIIIKKKIIKSHGHHGGAWKVAYADFVTAMMAFFMVMWIIGMDEEDRSVIQAYFEDPVGFSKNQARAAVNFQPVDGKPTSKPGSDDKGNHMLKEHLQARAEIDALQKEIEKEFQDDPELRELLKGQAIEITTTEEGLLIEFIENEMNGEVFFKLGSDEVRPQARLVMSKIAPILGRTGRPMIVSGHTDARPFVGTSHDNFDLSYERANAVRKLLRSGGVNSEQLQEILAKADTEPRHEDPMHFSNRRVTILLPFEIKTGKVEGLPKDVLRESIEGFFKVPVRR